MKQIALLFIITVLFVNQQACTSRQQKDNQPTDSTALSTETTSPAADVAITGRLADLGLTLDSDWRGINLGDDFARVKAAEKGEAFENDAKHIGYTIEFQNLETADMLYYQTNQKVSAIDVDLFLNNRQSVTDYQKELTPYFTARYGTPKAGKDGTLWTGPKGQVVALKDVSKGKDFGLKINMSNGSGATTASVK